MTVSPSPGNQNLILLAVIGIGAYWFMTQKAAAAAAPVYVRPGAGAAQTNGGAITGQLIGQGANLLGQLFKGLSGSGSSSASGLFSQYGYGSGYTDYAPVNIPVSELMSTENLLSGLSSNEFSLGLDGWGL